MRLMRPVLFRFRGRPVWSYPAMLYLGLSFGLVLGNVEANLRGLDGTRVYVAMVLLVVPALVGARLVYVAGHWDLFRRDHAQVWRHSVGGQTMYGGLLAVPLSIPLLSGLGVPFWSFWDVATFTMLTGMVFTRLGCLLQGCCLGRVTDRFGLVLRDHAGVLRKRIPTPLLEAGLGAAVLAMVAAIPPGAPPGDAFLAALAAYGAGRVLLQGTRQDERRVVGVGAQRAFSALLVVGASGLLAVSVLKF